MAEKAKKIKELAVFALGLLIQSHVDDDFKNMVKKFGSNEESTFGTINHVVKEAIEFEKSDICDGEDFIVTAIEKIMKEEIGE